MFILSFSHSPIPCSDCHFFSGKITCLNRRYCHLTIMVHKISFVIIIQTSCLIRLASPPQNGHFFNSSIFIPSILTFQQSFVLLESRCCALCQSHTFLSNTCFFSRTVCYARIPRQLCKSLLQNIPSVHHRHVVRTSFRIL